MMDQARVIEIIEAYGADARRWPDDEREMAQTLVSSSLPLRRKLDEAAALDRMLMDWSQGGPADNGRRALRAADAALTATMHPARRWLPAGLFGGMAAAAAIAAAIVLSPASVPQQAATQAPAQQTADTSDTLDNHLWSMTFTPTPEEESLI